MSRWLPASAHYRPGPCGVFDAEFAAWIVGSTNLQQVFVARGRDIDRGVVEQLLALVRLASDAASANASAECPVGDLAEGFEVVGDRPLSAAEAGALLGLTAAAMTLAAREKRIPAGRSGRPWWFNRDDVLDYGRRRAA